MMFTNAELHFMAVAYAQLSRDDQLGWLSEQFKNYTRWRTLHVFKSQIQGIALLRKYTCVDLHKHTLIGVFCSLSQSFSSVLNQFQSIDPQIIEKSINKLRADGVPMHELACTLNDFIITNNTSN